MVSQQEQAIYDEADAAWKRYRKTIDDLAGNPEARAAKDFGQKIDAAVSEIYQQLTQQADKLKNLKR